MLLVLGLTLVLASLSYSSLLQRGYVVVKFATLLVGATALLSLGTYFVTVGKRFRELRDPLVYLLFAEIGVMLFSVAISGQGWVSFLGSITRVMGAVTIVCFVVAGLAVILAVGERRERLVVLLRVISGAAALSALNAIFEWPTHHEFRAPGLVGNAEFLSNYLLFGALGAVGLTFVERRRGWAIFAIVAAALASVGMAVCKTRGAWLGYGAGVGALLLLSVPRLVSEELVSRVKGRLALLLGATLGVAILAALWGYGAATNPIEFHLLLPFLPVGGVLCFALPWFFHRLRFVRHAVIILLAATVLVTGLAVKFQLPILPHKAAEALRVTQESARGVVRDDTARMLSKYWLVGCGIENFRVAFLEFKSERLARYDPRVNYRNPHHMLYYEWTTSGLPGVLVFLGMLGVAVLWLLRARRRERDNEWGLLATAIIATLAAYTLQNFFNYDVIPTGLHYYVFLGMAVVLYRTAGKGSVKEEEPPEGEASKPDKLDKPDKPDKPDDDSSAEPQKADSDKKTVTNAVDGKTTEAASVSRGKKKRSKMRMGYDAQTPRKEARRQARRDGKEDRKKIKELDLLEQRRTACVRWLAIGLGGALALYVLMYLLPGLSDLFRFWPGSESAPARKDGVALALLSLWAIAWSAAGLSQRTAKAKVSYLTIGLVGFALFYAFYYLVPFTRDLLQGATEEGAARVKEDVLPGIFLLSWAGFWLITAFGHEDLEPENELASKDDQEGVSMGRQNSFALGLLVLVFVGTGSWWAGQQLKSDYHMYRAMYYSGMANSPIGQVQQLQDSLRQISRRQQQHRQRGEADQAQRYEQRKLQLQRQQQQLGARIQRYLEKVQHHGRTSVKALEMLGYYHFQYSKALHPFLKVKSALSNGEAVLGESLRHALKSVHQNTNPESAWSHLAVVHLAKQDLPRAKAALARSIQYDPYYYDTHRMMALLHLQDGHINDAEREMHRSLDITAGKHFHFSVTALHHVLAALKKGDEAAADKARAEMWYWLKRGLNMPDLPIPVLHWWYGTETGETLRSMAASLTASDGKPSAKAIAVASRKGFGRPSHQHLHFYRALREILHGEPTAATSILLGLEFRTPPLEDTLEAVINLLSSTSQLDSDLERLAQLGPTGGTLSPQVDRMLFSMANRLLDKESALYRRLTRRLASLLEEGDTSGAKRLAAGAAPFLSKLHEAQVVDYFSLEFRRAYGQVLTAREQVDEAATPAGRLARAESFLARRSPAVSLRIAEEALARFPEGHPKLHYVHGASLDAMGRTDEALSAYETYLRLAPNGDRAERARQRVQAIGGQ
jgi:tetratricopeptide (TPR) repeat protein